jgi:hypothetical protein
MSAHNATFTSVCNVQLRTHQSAPRREGGSPTRRRMVAVIVRADLTAATGPRTRYGNWTKSDLEQHAQRLVACFLRRYAESPVMGCELRFDLEFHAPGTGEFFR